MYLEKAMTTTPSPDWKEQIAPDEAEQFQALAENMREMQRRNARGGAASRALHAVGQAGLEGELTIRSDLPEYARVGLFAEPNSFRAYVRFSNGAGRPQPDRNPAVRGVGIKVVGVPGKKLLPGLEDAATQDFLLINSRTTLFHSAEEFVSFVIAGESPIRLLGWVLRRRGFFGGMTFMRKLIRELSKPVVSLATTAYDSALPLKFGPYAVHFALKPLASPEPGAEPGKTPEYLKEELEARLERGPVVYEFGAHFYRDEARTPIEDATREWSEEDAPFVPLARLTLPRQSPSSARGRLIAERVERMSFDVWHTTEDFRPLGNLMRARRVAYRLSTEERGIAPEPASAIDELGEA
jgi:hypothetical protein